MWVILGKEKSRARVLTHGLMEQNIKVNG